MLVSCNSKDDFVQKPVDDDGERGLLTLTSGESSALAMSHKGEEFKDIYFTADEPWTVSYPDWMEVVDAENADRQIGHTGTTRLAVRVRPNLSFDNRDATIEIKGTRTKEILASLNVTQPKVVFEVASGVENIPFEWYQFQIMDTEKDEPAKVQPYRKQLSLNSNVEWEPAFSEGADQFAYSSERVSGGATIDLVPLRPCIGGEDLDATVTFAPRFPGITLTEDEAERIAAYFTYTVRLYQTHFLFEVDWANGKDPVLSELGVGLSGQSVSFTVKSDTTWHVSAAQDWLQLSDENGPVEPGTTLVEGSDEPHPVRVSAVWANPSFEPRPFSIVLTPSLPQDVRDALTEEAVEQLNATINGTQKGLVFNVEGAQQQPCGYDFANEDIGFDVPQTYRVRVKTSGTFEDVCGFNTDEYTWFGCKVSPDTDVFPLDSIYTLTFSLKEQNLQWEPISTPQAGPDYQTGYAFYAPSHRAAGNAYALVPNASLFAAGSELPQIPFVFSQAGFVFDVQWPQELESILPRSLARHNVSVKSTGRWEYEVTYNPDNDPAHLDWIANMAQTGLKGDRTVQFGASTFNPSNANPRSATVRFTSLNHKENNLPLEGSELTFTIRQNEYRFLIRETAAESSPAVTSLGKLPAYQTDSDKCEFFLECGGMWWIAHCPSFLSPSTAGSDSEEGFKGMLSFTILPNISPDERQDGEIVIQADNDGEPLRVSVSQEGFVFDFSQEQTDLEPYNESQILFGRVTLTRGVSWRVIDADTRALVLSPAKGTGSSQDILFLPENNLTSRPRSVHYLVQVTDPADVPDRPLDLTQGEFLFSIGQDSFSFSELATESAARQSDVVCSGPWRIRNQNSLAEGFHCSKPSDGSIRVWTDRNLNQKERTQQIVVESIAHSNAGVSGWTRTITVAQEKFIWGVSGNLNPKFAAVPKTDDLIPLTVQCSSGWTVKLLRDGKEIPFDTHLSVKKEPASSGGLYTGDEGGKSFDIQYVPLNNLEPGSPKVLTLRLQSEFYDGSNGLSADVTVTQDQFNWVPELQGTYEWASTASDGKTFRITSAGDWELRNKSGNRKIENGDEVNGWRFTWGTVVHDKPTVVTMKPTANYERSSRALSLSLVSLVHEEAGRAAECTESLDLYQSEYEFHWGVGTGQSNLEKSLSLGPLENGIEEFPITCTDWSDFTISNTPAWLHVSKDVSNRMINVRLDTNTDPSNYNQDRPTTTVAFTSHGLRIWLIVNQSRYNFVVNRSSVHVDPEGTKVETVSVTSSGGFTVVREKDWVSLNGAYNDLSLSGNQNIKISAAKDASGSEEGRSSQIYFRCADVKGLELSLTLNQTPYILRFSGDNLQTEYYYSPDAGFDVPLNLETTVSWELKGPDWMKFTPASGTVSASQEEPLAVSFLASSAVVNPQKVRRSGTISLWPKAGSTSPAAQINVWQDAFLVEGKPEPFISVNAAPQPVTVYATNDWTLDPARSASWLDYDRMTIKSGYADLSGTGTQVAVFVTDYDNVSSDREGIITFVSDTYPGVTRTVPVKQSKFVWQVTPSGSSEFAPLAVSGASYNLAVSTVGEFETTLDPADANTWLSVENGGGTDAGTVVVRSTDDYLGHAERTATVTVRHKTFTGKSSQFTVKQLPYVFSVKNGNTELASGSTLYFSPDGSSASIDVVCSGTYHVQGQPDWLTVESKGSGYSLTASANGTLDRRTGTVTFVCEQDATRNIEVAVVQEVFYIDGYTFSKYNELNPGFQSFEIIASGEWTAVPSDTWITLNTYSGNVSSTINVSVANNVSTSERNGSVTVTFTAPGVAPLTRVVNFTQAAYRWDATDVLLEGFQPVNSGSMSFAISCSGDWAIENPTDWIIVTDSSFTTITEGSSDAFVRVYVTDNVNGDDRSATLIIRSKDNAALTRKVVVTQPTFLFDSTPVALDFAAVSEGSQSVDVVCTGDWNVTGNSPDWLLWSIEDGATVIVNVEPNTELVPRSGSITIFSLSYSGFTKVITVNQAAATNTP